MFVGVARLTLQIADSGSLKSKRQVLRRVTDRVKARFNVSVAEVDNEDLWQRATLAVACVANDARFANEVVSKAVNYIESLSDGAVIDVRVEVL